MRKYVSNFSLSILLFFIFVITSSLVLALLSYNKIISFDISKLVAAILSVVICFIVGIFFGKKCKKRGLLNGVLLASIFAVFLLLYYGLDNRPWELSNTLVNGARVLMIIFGTVIGVNMSKR